MLPIADICVQPFRADSGAHLRAPIPTRPHARAPYSESQAGTRPGRPLVGSGIWRQTVASAWPLGSISGPWVRVSTGIGSDSELE